MPTRRIMTAGLSAAAASLLASCGTIIYPARVNQEERGNLDPLVIVLNGVGLFFFLIPGVVAFAVDFTTGAIYLPEGKEQGDKERTIFDDLSMCYPAGGTLRQKDIEAAVAQTIGMEIDLSRSDIKAVQLNYIDQFWLAHAKLSGNAAVVLSSV